MRSPCIRTKRPHAIHAEYASQNHWIERSKLCANHHEHHSTGQNAKEKKEMVVASCGAAKQ